MSGDGITGLDSLRSRVDTLSDTLSDVRAAQAAQGATLQAQGRELGEVKATGARVEGKVDGIAAELAQGAGVSAGKRGTLTGAKDVLATLAAIAGVVTAIVVAAIK